MTYSIDASQFFDPEDPATIAHYGTPRHSGRYPWGSGGEEGGTPRNATLLSKVDQLKREHGFTETQAAKAMGLTSTEVRDMRTLVRNEQKQNQIHMARALAEKNMSNGAIAARLREAGYKVSGESTVRNLLKETNARKAKVLDTVVETLRKAVDEKEYLDVGSGTEYQLNITSTKLRAALKALQNEGYTVHPLKVEQLGTGEMTNMKVMVKPGVDWKTANANRDKIKQLQDYSDDGGLTVLNILPPKSISSKRVGIRYAKDGGADADGVIYVRPGVPEVSLGKGNYAQVRVAVDGTHYLKGMAVYKDDLPDGVDLQFNTNKDSTGNKLDAMKPLKRVRVDGDDPLKPEKYSGPVDQDNPFGATISHQVNVVRDPHSGKALKLTNVMNIVNEEGKWETWSRNLSSQMLSKQPTSLAKEQLTKTQQQKRQELDEILSLTNPSVKAKLLQAYTDGVDSAAVHLRAAAMPRQQTQVLLPLHTIKANEVYAPNFNHGETVVLVRFPHGGTFEIPEVKVNNNNPEGKRIVGPEARDAIGIHPKVAERLSGADFDGDTVLVIPNPHGKIKSTPALKGLEGFSAKDSYPYYPGMKIMTSHEKGTEMGKISNLITDMTIRHATNDELARAVRHSMVVIDAEKHKLDYKRSYEANGIAALVKRYQPGTKAGGASTLISKATSRFDVADRTLRAPKDGGPVDPKTGKLVYTPTGKGRTRVDSKGNEHFVPKMIESKKLAETDDARTLSSGTVIEEYYASHSNALKGLANEGRKVMVQLKPLPYSSRDAKAYSEEVASLNAKLRQSLENAPRERAAQVIANATVRSKIEANPYLKLKENRAELKRLKSQALAAARARTDAAKFQFEITDAEWNAIQAGAIAPSKVDTILNYVDLKRVKELATPRTKPVVSTAQASRAKAMRAAGRTWAEIASALGVSLSSIKASVDGGED